MKSFSEWLVQNEQRYNPLGDQESMLNKGMNRADLRGSTVSGPGPVPVGRARPGPVPPGATPPPGAGMPPPKPGAVPPGPKPGTPSPNAAGAAKPGAAAAAVQPQNVGFGSKDLMNVSSQAQGLNIAGDKYVKAVARMMPEYKKFISDLYMQYVQPAREKMKAMSNWIASQLSAAQAARGVQQ